MTKVNIKGLLLLVLFIIGTGFGAALIMQVAIGVSAWDALTQSSAEVIGIQIGTMGIALNTTCLILQLLILRKQTHWSIIFQFPMSLLLGVAVNFSYYTFLSNFHLDNYFLQIVFFLIGNAFLAGSIAGILVLNIMTFPVEGLCLVISQRTRFSFVQVRQAIDFFCVAMALLIFVIFRGTMTVREGTIIGMLIFSPMIGLFMKLWSPLLKREMPA